MLGDWTPEWSAIARSITQYVILKRKEHIKQGEIVTEYNEWLHWSGLSVSSIELVKWSMGYIERAWNCPLEYLISAAEMDDINLDVHKSFTNN